MKKPGLIAVTGLLMVGVALGQAPRFSGPTRIESNGVPIDLGNYTAPVMFDWNGDGKKDMVVGQFSQGQIAFFENVGEDSAPVFAGLDYLRADGEIIRLPSG